MNVNEIMEIEKKKEQLKVKQKELWIKYGVQNPSTALPWQLSNTMRQMLDVRNLNDDYDIFIELEKEYVACNNKLISIGININKLHEKKYERGC